MRYQIPIVVFTLLLVIASAGAQSSEDEPKKRIIGATATITIAEAELPFAARIDTGAATCLLHVEKVEIKDESTSPIDNIGKPIRFLVKNESGDEKWIDSTVTRVVQIRSDEQDDGELDRRYKVPLTLVWEDFRKTVLFTLNDHTEMTYPLVVGRNYLRGDFLVDVDLDNPD